MPNPPPSPATPPPWFQFGKLRKTKARTIALKGIGVSANTQNAALLFDDLRVELATAGDKLSMAVSTEIELPAKVLSDAEFRGYAVDVRGNCDKNEGGRGVVIVQVGGTTHTQVFAYDEVPGGEWLARFYTFERRLSGNTEPPPPQLPPLTVNVLISVQRRKPADSITLTVDSIDITADRV